jgi:predicted small lipoprotein YifL
MNPVIAIVSLILILILVAGVLGCGEKGLIMA